MLLPNGQQFGEAGHFKVYGPLIERIADPAEQRPQAVNASGRKRDGVSTAHILDGPCVTRIPCAPHYRAVTIDHHLFGTRQSSAFGQQGVLQQVPKRRRVRSPIRVPQNGHQKHADDFSRLRHKSSL